eukprot:3274_1
MENSLWRPSYMGCHRDITNFTMDITPVFGKMHGIHKWKLNDSELQTVHNGSIGDYIAYPKVINTPIPHNNDTTAFHLSFFPRGYYDDNNTSKHTYLSIHTRSIPHNISNILINYNIKIMEIKSFIWSE